MTQRREYKINDTLITGALINVAKTKLFKVDAVDPDKESRTSYFGTPVFSNIQIDPFNYETLDGETVEIKNGITIDTVLISITQTKNIVTTAVQGRNGTVKEYIADGDYQIDIAGKIVSESNNYPEKDVNEFIQIMKSPVAIRIISEYLQWFDIHDVVVESFTMPQTEGVRNEQVFQISCLSDTPIELDNESI